MKSKFYSDWKRKVGILSILTKYNNMKDSEENYYQSMSQFQVELFANAGNSKVWTNRLRENLLNDLFHSILAQKTSELYLVLFDKTMEHKGKS
jgi:hypothetical protein